MGRGMISAASAYLSWCGLRVLSLLFRSTDCASGWWFNEMFRRLVLKDFTTPSHTHQLFGLLTASIIKFRTPVNFQGAGKHIRIIKIMESHHFNSLHK